jgi:hypothetical protein
MQYTHECVFPEVVKLGDKRRSFDFVVVNFVCAAFICKKAVSYAKRCFPFACGEQKLQLRRCCLSITSREQDHIVYTAFDTFRGTLGTRCPQTHPLSLE